MLTVEKQDYCKVTFRNLNYSVSIPKKKKLFQKAVFEEKIILDNVSGCFQPARLTAVMGASGAGKTSLLQLLAGEVRQGHLSGEILVNNRATDGKLMKKDDVILSTMTVREAITMSAQLRLGQSIPVSEKLERVESTIKLLGLEKCADTIIGDSVIKGISGGERKRTAMAMEIITNPAILFLDEPTSGLDTFTAYSVVRRLKDLSSSGRTVIATIHQPSSDVFQLFDDLILLAEGRVIYAGPISKTIDYFAQLHFQCPQYSNPADFLFMAILNNEEEFQRFGQGETSALKETNKQRIDRLLQYWDKSPENSAVIQETRSVPDRDVPKQSYKQKSSFLVQYQYLLKRASKNAFRNPFIVRAKLGQTLVLAIIIGLLYKDLPSRLGASGLQDRAGLLFFLAVNNVFGSSIGILSIFGAEKLVFNREQGAGYYTLASYFISKIMVEIPFQILMPLIQAAIVYFLAGLQNDAGKFFILCSMTILCSISGFALGIFFASVFSNLETALAATPLCLLPLMLFSGLFANQESIPNYFNWIKYISPMKYGFEGMFKNEFTGLTIPTKDKNVTLSGDRAIVDFGLDDGLSILSTAVILIGMCVFLILAAYAALYRIQWASRPVALKPKANAGVTVQIVPEKMEDKKESTLEPVPSAST